MDYTIGETKAKCCPDRNGISITTNSLSQKDALNLLNLAIMTKIMEDK